MSILCLPIERVTASNEMPSPTGSTGDCREARREVCRQGAGTAGTTVNVCTASTTTTVVDSRSSNGGNARSSVSTSGRSVLRPASTSIAAAALVVSIGAAAASAASFSPSTSSAASSPAFCLPQPARVPPRAGQQQFRRKSSVAVAPGMRPNIHVAREVVIGGGGRAVSSLRCASGRAAGGRSREGAPPQGHGGRGATRLSSAVEHAGEAGVPAVMFATAATEKATGRGVSVTGSTRTRRKGVERSRDASAAAAAAGLGDGLGASSKLSGDPRATTAQQVRRRSREDSAYFGDSRGSARELEQQRGKLLTHDEEMELGTKVQRYLRLLEVRSKKVFRWYNNYFLCMYYFCYAWQSVPGVYSVGCIFFLAVFPANELANHDAVVVVRVGTAPL